MASKQMQELGAPLQRTCLVAVLVLAAHKGRLVQADLQW